MDPVREAQQAHAVASPERDVAEQERGVYREIQASEIADPSQHHAAKVEHHHEALTPLGLMQGSDRSVATSRRLPVDASEIVVGLVLAQTLELGATIDEA